MEFLIRRIDGEFVDLPADGHTCSVFQPHGFTTTLVEGHGVCAVRRGDAVFTFSLEEPGIQVVLASGDIEEAEALSFIEAVAAHLGARTRQRLEVLHYA